MLMIIKALGLYACKETSCKAHFCRRFSAQNNLSKWAFWKISHWKRLKIQLKDERKKSARGKEKSQ